MKNYTYYKEVRTLIAQFIDSLSNILIKRYDNTDTSQDQIMVNTVYAPKSRVLHDLVNQAAVIKLPVVACSLGGITRDNNRVFNKLVGPLYTLSNAASAYEKIGQPVPIDVTINVSIITRFQSDMDQILSNFVPYSDPYFVISWKLPSIPNSDLGIHSPVIWSGNINLQYPTDISHSDYYRQTADTSFVIKGWIFKKPYDPIGKIYTIDASFTAVDEILNNYTSMTQKMCAGLTTDYFTISARPQISYCDPYLTMPCMSSTEIILQGKMFNYVTDLFVSGGPGVYPMMPSGLSLSSIAALTGSHMMEYNLASGQRISAYYPAFSGVRVGEWEIDSDNLITFTLPVPVSAGYIDVIAWDEAGYGRLTQDAIRTTINPYPSSMPEYNTWVGWQHPSISGIQVLPNYYNCG